MWIWLAFTIILTTDCICRSRACRKLSTLAEISFSSCKFKDQYFCRQKANLLERAGNIIVVFFGGGAVNLFQEVISLLWKGESLKVQGGCLCCGWILSCLNHWRQKVNEMEVLLFTCLVASVVGRHNKSQFLFVFPF